MNNESTNTIVCRKCGGPHFTIKCSRDIDKSSIQSNESIKHSLPLETIKHSLPLETIKHSLPLETIKHNKYYSKIVYRVKLSELPTDMTEEEMMELTSDWGHIVRIKVINYNENSVAYIDFGFENESKYFIEAIDKTPFESLLLSATRVDS
jgi:hypothetical protein